MSHVPHELAEEFPEHVELDPHYEKHECALRETV